MFYLLCVTIVQRQDKDTANYSKKYFDEPHNPPSFSPYPSGEHGNV